MDDTTKRCTHCGETRPLKQFYRVSGKPHLRQSWCKFCYRALSASRYETTKAAVAFYKAAMGTKPR